MNATISLLIGLALGGVFGGLIGWLLGSRRSSAHGPDTRLESELREQLTRRETELAQLRQEQTETNSARAAAEAKQSAAEKLLIEQRALHEKNLRVAGET